MFSYRNRKALSSLLALGLLLATGLAPALRHTHGRAVVEGSARTNPGGEMTARSTHWHLLWWGLSFELESTPSEDDEPARVEPGLMAVALVDPGEALAAQPADSPQDHALVSLDIAAGLAPATFASQPLVDRTLPIRALPLCDAARLERSGVQRI